MDTQTEGTLHMVYKLEPEQLPKRWVVKSSQFKTFAYGETKEKAKEAFQKAVKGAVSHFTDRESRSNYLNATGIQWWVEEEDLMHQELQIPAIGA